MQSFLFFLFSQPWVSYFPIFLSNHAAGHAAVKVEQGHFERQLIFLEVVLSIVNSVNKVYSLAYDTSVLLTNVLTFYI